MGCIASDLSLQQFVPEGSSQGYLGYTPVSYVEYQPIEVFPSLFIILYM